MQIEELLSANTAALSANTEVLKQVLAGQATVIEHLTSTKADGTPKKGKTGETPAPATTTAPTKAELKAAEKAAAKAEAEKKAAAKGKGIPKFDEVIADLARNKFLRATEDAEERQERGSFIMALAQNFGVGKLTEITDPEDQAGALWLLKRKIAGLPVDFKADYDFDTDPAVDDDAPAEDDDGI